MLEGVTASEFREKMKDVVMEKEREASAPMPARRAKDLTAAEAVKEIANDNKPPVPKQPFKPKQKALAPRLRRKMWYGDAQAPRHLCDHAVLPWWERPCVHAL